MPNFFTILDLPESLSLESEAIEAAWESRTRQERPDLSTGENREGDRDSDPADLHQARAVLSDPVERLAHWLEQKGVESPRGTSIEPDLMDLFSRLHDILATVDSLLSKHQQATTALTKAMLTKEAVTSQLELQNCLQEIQTKKQNVIDQFPLYESEADQQRFTSALEGLAQLKFLRKWEQQCQDRLLGLIEI